MAKSQVEYDDSISFTVADQAWKSSPEHTGEIFSGTSVCTTATKNRYQRLLSGECGAKYPLKHHPPGYRRIIKNVWKRHLNCKQFFGFPERYA
jgi:hypothetical protein